MIFEVIIKCIYRTSTAGGAVKTANMKYSSIKATCEYSVRTGKEYSRFVCQCLLVPDCPGDLPLLHASSFSSSEHPNLAGMWHTATWPSYLLPDWEKPLVGPQIPSLWISNRIPQLLCSEPKNRARASSPPTLCSSAGQSHLFPFNTTLPFVTLENRRCFS